MDSYRLLLFLHVVFVVVAFGVTFGFPFLQGAAERRGPGAVRLALTVMRRVELFVVLPGATLVFLFGIGLIFEDVTGYRDDMPAWLELSIGLFIIAYLMGLYQTFVVHPKAHDAIEPVPDGAPLPSEYETYSKRLQMVGGTLALIILVITFLMTYKPVLWD